MQDDPESNLYYTLRDEVIKTALRFSRKITAYAMLEELSDLQATFCYSHQELMLSEDNKLIIVCHRIITKLQELQDDMSEYGVDECSMTSFLELTEHFQTAINSKLSPMQNMDKNHDVLTQ